MIFLLQYIEVYDHSGILYCFQENLKMNRVLKLSIWHYNFRKDI